MALRPGRRLRGARVVSVSRHWTRVSASLQVLTTPIGGFEYRIRNDGNGSVMLYQEDRRTGHIVQRQECHTEGWAYTLADSWIRDAAIVRGPW